MNIAIKDPLHMTFEQYVTGQFDCPWSDCLWVEGDIVEVPPETGLNNEIARYLILAIFNVFPIQWVGAWCLLQGY